MSLLNPYLQSLLAIVHDPTLDASAMEQKLRGLIGIRFGALALLDGIATNGVALAPGATVTAVPQHPITTQSPTRFKSLGAATKGTVKVGAATQIFSVSLHNGSASEVWLQLFNLSSAPANAAVPEFTFLVPPGTQLYVGPDWFTEEGHSFITGFAFGVSSNKVQFADPGTASNYVFQALYK